MNLDEFKSSLDSEAQRKAVLLSIRPKWCELIASGKKTIEVRKTRPNLETPFKCYIYETRGFERVGNENLNCVVGGNGRGAVIGEFVCNRIESTNCFSGWVCPEKNNIIKRFLDGSCLSEREIVDYADGCAVCGWHISELKVYDKPKKLSEFGVSRAPQAWRFIDDSDKRI